MITQVKYLPHHTCISVRNLSKSLEFYKMLGYEQVHQYDEPDGSMSITHLKLGSSFLEIFWYKKNETELPIDYNYTDDLKQVGVKHIALQTDDIEASLEDLKKKGLTPEDTTITFGRTKVSYFFIKDPDGIWLEIVKDDRYN